MKKQPELTALTRKNLIDAYFQLRARGEKGTVGAVSELAGYNRCTFYRYFADTEQLLYDVETEICGAFREALPKEFPTEMPLEIIASLVGVYQKYGGFLSVLLGSRGDPRFVARMKGIVQPMASQLFAAASESPAAAELKTEFVMAAVLAAVTKWYDMGQPITAEALGREIQAVLQNGVFGS